MKTMRVQLAEKYGIGKCLEIGALNSPWPGIRGEVKYLDHLSAEDLQMRNPAAKNIITPDYICSAEFCEGVPGGFDAVFSSHVLEHCENAIDAISSWLSLVKVGGYIVMAVPDMRYTFDREREVTQMSHFYREWISHDFMISNRKEHLWEIGMEDNGTKPDIHFHCWTEESMADFLGLSLSIFRSFTAEFIHLVDFEIFCVLKKV
jgi:SAM-dependent methyltransferase